MKGTGTFAAMQGTAKALVADGATNVTFTLDGGVPGASYPWHVHDGKCASGGPVTGSPSAYTPITIGSNGHGETSAHLTMQLDEAKEYHVNVHASASDMATIIACGDLND